MASDLAWPLTWSLAGKGLSQHRVKLDSQRLSLEAAATSCTAQKGKEVMDEFPAEPLSSEIQFYELDSTLRNYLIIVLCIKPLLFYEPSIIQTQSPSHS